MHTTPLPISPLLCALNPRISTIAFYSNKGTISLYRLNGELVWTCPARKQTAAVRLIWSPSGENLAVIYGDGLFQILHENSGKIAQIVANQNASTIVWQTATTRQPPAFEVPNQFGWTENLIWAVGGRNSALKINLDGFLALGALTFDATAIQQIRVQDQRSYSVLTESALYIVQAEYFDKYTDRQVDDLIIKPAKIQKLLDQLVTADAKFQSEQGQFVAALRAFLLDEDPVTSLYTTMVTGFPDPSAAQWIEDMHEAAFRRWVKASDQYYNGVQQLLGEQFIPLLQHIIIYLGDLFLEDTFLEDCEAVASCRNIAGDILAQLFSLCEQAAKEKQLYQSFAAALQHIYYQHLDRAINVVDKATTKGADWIDASEYVRKVLASPGSLICPSSLVNEFKEEFGSVMARIKTELHEQLKVVKKGEWGLKLHEMTGGTTTGATSPTAYYILAKSAEDVREAGEADTAAVAVSPWSLIKWFPSADDNSSSITPLGDLVQVFIADGHLVTLEPQTLRVLNLELEPLYEHHFEYNASGCAVRGDKACIVSEDCTHFEVHELKY